MIETIKTGIKGFDDLFLDKGMKKNSMVIVSGAPGTGKSILLWQFLYNGAKLYNEPGILVSIDMDAKTIREQAKELGFNFEELEKKKLLTIIENPLLSKSIFGTTMLSNEIKNKGVKRVAIDSLTLFRYFYPPKTLEYRRETLKFLKQMKQAQVTLMGSTEREHLDVTKVDYNMQDYLFDGLVLLGRIRKGATFERVLSIAKMRGQGHILNVCPFKISNKGIEVFPRQTPFALLEEDIKKK